MVYRKPVVSKTKVILTALTIFVISISIIVGVTVWSVHFDGADPVGNATSIANATAGSAG